MKELIDYFHDKEVKTVLDLGTGSGDFLTTLKEVFPGAKITATDPDTGSLNEAKEKFPGVQFRNMKAENIGFPDNSFDVAAISMALHHLADVGKALHEMQRVVKPGGWIIVSELFADNLNPAQEVHKLYHHFASQTDRIKGTNHNKTFQKNEILKHIEEAGIKIRLQFEFNRKVNLISNTEELETRVNKMKAKLETIAGRPEYGLLKPKVEEFREKAAKYGFQPATKIVVVGQ